MPAVKKSTADKKGYLDNAIISDKVKDHENDPFIVKKVEEAKAFLRKNGLNGLLDRSA